MYAPVQKKKPSQPTGQAQSLGNYLYVEIQTQSHLVKFGQLNAGALDWAGHVDKMGVTRKAYNILVGKTFR
jgi:hypothetical protein